MNIVQQEELNFLLTNRIPRRTLTRFMGWFSRVEQPLVRDASLFVWKFFADLDLSDAQQTRFRSMHDCFTRRLKDGARPVDPDPSIVVSPCDAIIGASGRVTDGQVLQVKGIPYALDELLGDPRHAAVFHNGCYVTLRLTSSMYHRFHAPHDCQVNLVSHFPGDAWNVNPPTLKRIQGLFCKNERAVIRTRLAATGHAMTLVPVAAILVAGIRLNFLDLPRGPDRRDLSCKAALGKGEEMGWFEHGSTIIMFLPDDVRLCEDVTEGRTIRAGQRLFQIGAPSSGADGPRPGPALSPPPDVAQNRSGT
jgi:phosphatidylserine decarboxylase